MFTEREPLVISQTQDVRFWILDLNSGMEIAILQLEIGPGWIMIPLVDFFMPSTLTHLADYLNELNKDL